MATSSLRPPRPLPGTQSPHGEGSAHTPPGPPHVLSTRTARAGAAGTLALAGLAASIALIALGTAAAPSAVVPESSRHFFPAWLAGPLHSIAFRGSTALLVALVLLACTCYVVVLRCVEAIGVRRLWAAIAFTALAGALAPPLFSGDLFGYIGYARLAALHGLSPYTHGAAAAHGDAISALVGWPKLTTPYGPLFTLASEALAPLSIAAAMWVLKAVAALASLATVALIWRTAPRVGRSPRACAAFYALNPLVLVFAIPGAHNEALIGVLLAAGAAWILTGSEARGSFALVGACAVKASAALALPFALIGSRARGRAALALAAAIAITAAVSVIAFGPSLSPLGAALATQQGLVAGHSLPSEVSKLLGLGKLALGVRVGFIVFAAAAFLVLVRRCLRGAPWLDCYGWSTLALLAATAWLWPWYGLWALLPASLSSSRRLRVATLLASAYLVAIRVAIHHPLSAG